MDKATSKRESKKCVYAGEEYSEGSTVCQSGSTYICRDGEWEFHASGCDETERENSGADLPGSR